MTATLDGIIVDVIPDDSDRHQPIPADEATAFFVPAGGDLRWTWIPPAGASQALGHHDEQTVAADLVRAGDARIDRFIGHAWQATWRHRFTCELNAAGGCLCKRASAHVPEGFPESYPVTVVFTAPARDA
jgi:hypothetical protein